MNPELSRRRWWLVAILWLVCVLNYADRQAISAMFPMLKARFGFDSVELGLIGSAFAWTYAAGSPIAGYLGDRLSRKKLILFGCLLWSGLTAITGACGRLWQFFVVRALVGSGETVYFPAALSLMSDYHGPRTRSRALALHQSGVYIGTILGSVLGAALAVAWGWRVAFIWFGASGIVLCVVIILGVKEPQGRTAATTPRVGEVIRSLCQRPAAWVLMLVFVGANFMANIVLVWMISFLYDKFGLSLVKAGVLAVIYIQPASAIGSPVGGWLADVLAQRRVGGRMLVQALGLILGAGCIYRFATTTDMAALPLALIGFGFCKGLYDSNIWAALYDYVEPHVRGSATGVGNTLGWVGGVLGPLYVGFFTKYGGHARPIDNMSEAFAAGSVIYLVCGAVLVVLFALAPKLSHVETPATPTP